MNLFFKRTGYLLAAGLLLMIAGLSPARAQQGKFWGMTPNGGKTDNGAIFTMNADGTGTTVVYSFTGATGSNPQGGLTESGGLLYSVTTFGGANNAGVIFSYDTAAGTYTDVHDFDNTNGASPTMEPTAGYSDGKLYGVTVSGGANGGGVIYSFDPSTKIFAKLYDMPYGAGSTSALTLYHNKFYGLTVGGGGASTTAAMLFAFDPATNTLADVYDYPGQVFYQPADQMAVYNDVLYGVDGYNNTELFSYSDAGGGTYTTLVSFGTGSSTLSYCYGVLFYNNMLYGIATAGGTNNYGGLWAFDPTTSTYSEPFSFDPSIQYLASNNVIGYNNKLFGIGGANLYQIDLANYSYTDLQDFFTMNPPLQYPSYGNLLKVAPSNVGTTPQTITFSGWQKAYGDADFDPGGTSSSGLGLTYTSSDTTIATITSGKIHIVGAGTCSFTASQSGNAKYAAAADVTVTLTITPASLLIAAHDTIKNELQPNPVFRLTYTGFVYSDDPTSLLTPAITSTTANQNSPSGTYPITLAGATSNNYTITYQGATLTVIGQYQTISFNDITKNYGDPEFDPGALASSGLPVTYTSSNPAVAVVTASGTLRIIGVGTDTITAIQAGDADWAPNSLARVLTVNSISLTITVDNKTKIYRQPDPVFTAVFSGLINGDTPDNIGAVFSSSDSSQNAGPGSYLINVNLGPAAVNNYKVIAYKSGILVITPEAGISRNSLDTWFSSNTSLQVNIWMTATQQAVVQVYDAGGRCLVNEAASFTQGYNTMTLPAAGLSSGVYIIKVTGNNFQLSKTIRKVSN